MKIDFDVELKTFNGTTLVNVAQKPLTLRFVCTDALMASFEDERGLSGEDKLKRYLLASKIHQTTDGEVTAEEVALLKLLIGKGFGPNVVGPAYLHLEQQQA